MNQIFLHLSDLHYRPHWPEETGLILESFFKDAALQLKGIDEPFLIFSGDLVAAAAESEIYEQFLSRFSGALDSINIPVDRRICIPGNHDVSRSALKSLLGIQKPAIEAIRDEETFNRELTQLTGLFFSNNFHPYITAERTFAKYTCCQKAVGGTGWDLENGIGVYCLNTALCSSAGLEDPSTGEKLSDEGRLMLDTRSLHQWLQTTKSKVRILVMHHPLTWLAEWARQELEDIIFRKFRLVLSGHVHRGQVLRSSIGDQSHISCVSPALFTRKREDLGYQILTVNGESGAINLKYRQKSDKHKFVTGSLLANNDSGAISFPADTSASDILPLTVMPSTGRRETRSILELEFDEQCTSYSSKRRIWVDRDLAAIPETAPNRDKSSIVDPISLSRNPHNAIIRAPREFGLSCLGRFLALDHHCFSTNGTILIFCDITDIPAHRQGVIKYVSDRCQSLNTTVAAVSGIILDNWGNEQNCSKILRVLKTDFAAIPVIILQGFDDFNVINSAVSISNTDGFETLYLWALKRTRVRSLAVSYLEQLDSALDEDAVTNKTIADLTALNIHRTPLNCLLILKLIEQSFDESPVNRTEVIGKVLWALFYGFNQIPRYATKPDLKDCEFALGYLCEWMIRGNKTSFTQAEFFQKIDEYCSSQMISLDVAVLFSFLATENILVRRGLHYAFRLSYWLYYFAAHRMHHSEEFAKFILSDSRYAAFPEMIEFYTGIDRRRTDAVVQITSDLKRMDSEFLNRTKIADTFNPLADFQWTPDTELVTRLQEDVDNSIQESALPSAVKDSIADKGYDIAQPYRQEVQQFLNQSTLRQMISAMRGAARALRNSDHVEPGAKRELLEAVIQCWFRVAQTLMFLSRILAANRKASFEEMNFFLDDTWDERDWTGDDLWKMIMVVIPDNIVSWHQADIFSKRLGQLFYDYIKNNPDSFGELMLNLVIIRQRPPGWEEVIKRFISRSHRNSFFLERVFSNCLTEFRIGFASEGARQELRTIAAIAVAKHHTGVKKPNQKLIEETAEKVIDKAASKDRTKDRE